MRERIATLTQQAEAHRDNSEPTVDTSDFAQGSDQYLLPISVKYWAEDTPTTSTYSKWAYPQAPTTWDGLFRELAPFMLDEASEETLDRELDLYASQLLDVHLEDLELPEDFDRFSRNAESRRGALQDVTVQFFTLGLIKKSDKRHHVNDKDSYWTLTEKGRSYLTRLRAIRRETNNGNTQTEDYGASAIIKSVSSPTTVEESD